MIDWDSGLFSPAQRHFVEAQLGAPELVHDFSWGITNTHVLHIQAGGEDFIAKAAPAGNHHIHREITAHETATAPLLALDLTARLVAASRPLNIIVVTYQRGTLLEGGPKDLDPEIHRQAGAALRALHEQAERIDEGYERRAVERALAWLTGEHRIREDAAVRARDVLAAYCPAPITVVPTHGDWQPRN